ncbi:MAG: aminotransferase class I/II-fold pyridoxal phosphate-dependent enzyme [Phycisphaerales bacterium]|nr:aminotransferase class I/II-fold pyridoxal phosphate-dependent enzyme [Phycisphaerales bacterium]
MNAPGGHPLPRGVSGKLAPFGTTIFTTMTKLAQEHGAVNLSQGFPDFDGPEFIKQAARDAIDHQPNQYAPMPGLPSLRQAIAKRFTRDTALPCDPDTQVVVTAGCTEGIAAALIGLCNRGDEVILFEPFYDSYRAAVAMAGASARFVALTPTIEEVGGKRVVTSFAFNAAQLRAAFGPRTRAVLVNTPHNPTGKVFSREELTLIAELCVEHNAVAIVDEVYERLLFDPSQPHVSIASLPGMAERTVTLSSLGKTFSFTGWKIGWSVASPALTAAVRAAHQFITFAVATPLQHAAAAALAREEEAVGGLVPMLRANRDKLATALSDLGFAVHVPAGTYFICADHTAVAPRLGASDDQSFCMALIKQCGVAAIPPSVFYNTPALGHSLVRFAFCKKPETIDEGIARLRSLR